MSRDKFTATLDRMILAGMTNAQVANTLSICESSVRKRKRVLRETGVLPSNPQFQARRPEKRNAIRHR
jgi:transposase